MRILGVFAHPDDEVFAAGGTLAKYAARAAETMVLSATVVKRVRSSRSSSLDRCSRRCSDASTSCARYRLESWERSYDDRSNQRAMR